MKKKLCLILVIMVILNSTFAFAEEQPAFFTSVQAAADSKIANCPRCKQLVRSYGVNRGMENLSVSVKHDNYCNGCNSFVEEGTVHQYGYTRDLYYFMCNSKKCSNLPINKKIFKIYFDNDKIEWHQISKLKES